MARGLSSIGSLDDARLGLEGELLAVRGDGNTSRPRPPAKISYLDDILQERGDRAVTSRYNCPR